MSLLLKKVLGDKISKENHEDGIHYDSAVPMKAKISDAVHVGRETTAPNSVSIRRRKEKKKTSDSDSQLEPAILCLVEMKWKRILRKHKDKMKWKRTLRKHKDKIRRETILMQRAVMSHA